MFLRFVVDAFSYPYSFLTLRDLPKENRTISLAVKSQNDVPSCASLKNFSRNIGVASALPFLNSYQISNSFHSMSVMPLMMMMMMMMMTAEPLRNYARKFSLSYLYFLSGGGFPCECDCGCCVVFLLSAIVHNALP